MSLPFLSLNGVTGTGAGDAHDLEGVSAYHRMVATMSGYSGSGTVHVVLETSLDGSTWLQYQSSSPTGAPEVQFTGDGTAECPLTTNDVGSPTASFAKPARYVRANVTRYDGTITSGAVTAYVASC